MCRVSARHPTTMTEPAFKLDDVQTAINAIRDGRFVLVVDDMSRENEGDLIIAAEKVTARQMAWMIQHSS